jgi:hypothetical protein
MRKTFDPQKTFGQYPIDQIKINMTAVMDTQLLLGLQHIYCNPEVRQKVFDIFKTMLLTM